MVKKLFLLVLFLFSAIKGDNAVEASIFIHGTRLSGLSLVSAIPTVKRTLKNNHLYTKVVQSSRDDVRFQDTQILLDRGLVEVVPAMLIKCRKQTLESTFSRKAAIQAINGYDMLNNDKQTTHRYYTYGWDGMLDDSYRKNDSLDLYRTLIKLRDKLQKEYPGKKIKLILHGHSHGGNIILYLGYHENEQRKNLLIEQTVFYGTPIQAETASYCLHHIFKNIINIYSEGDNIQVADKISTSTHTSKRQFSELVNIKNKHIIEVCVAVGKDRKAFGHASFFFIDMYQNGIANARRHVFNEIKYLPLVTFAPLFMPLIEQLYDQHKQQQMTLNFYKTDKSTCIMCAQAGCKQYTIRSQNLIPLINPINHIIRQTWKPAAEHTGAAHLAKLALLDLMKVAPQHLLHPKSTLKTN